MKKLILTQGIPASGKTTWAKEQIRKYPGRYKRVNRDSLRLMLDAIQFNAKREKFITKIQRATILAALEEGFHVICDDTNLNPKTIRSLTELVKGLATVEFKSFLDTPLQECICRDLKRERSVGEKVIRDFHKRYFPEAEVIPYPYNAVLDDCIICDLDGTLCKMVDRGPFEVLKCDTDEVNPAVLDILLRYNIGLPRIPIILMSGRDGIAKEKTLAWLKKHDVPYDALYMRTAGDFRKDAVIKEELFNANIKGKYNVKFCLDDRNQMVDHWRSMGLTCMQVAPGDF